MSYQINHVLRSLFDNLDDSVRALAINVVEHSLQVRIDSKWGPEKWAIGRIPDNTLARILRVKKSQSKLEMTIHQSVALASFHSLLAWLLEQDDVDDFQVIFFRPNHARQKQH